MNNIQAIQNSLERTQNEEDFVKKLKENPIQVSAFRRMVLDNPNIDQTQKIQLVADVNKYKEKGLVIDDIQPTWDEFRTAVAEEQSDHMPIKMSMYKNLTGVNLSIIHSVKHRIYDDVGGGKQAKIQHYSDTYGLKTSYVGEKPYSANVTTLDLNKSEDVKIFNESCHHYDNMMKDWELKKNTILKERGKSLAEHFPLEQSIVDKHQAQIEKQERAKYHAWKKTEAERTRVVPIVDPRKPLGNKLLPSS